MNESKVSDFAKWIFWVVYFLYFWWFLEKLTGNPDFREGFRYGMY